ncbi:MAG: hypothetical protein IJR85_11045 [Synergistaceae bacterium]|nr:hypothetical protein [Synergistaceae bacterium]
MKKLLCAVMCVLMASPAFALNEEEYRELLKDSEFAATDAELRQALSDAKGSLSKDAYDGLRTSQREWVRNVRDANAGGVVKAQQDEHAKTATTQAMQKSGAELLCEVLEKYGPEDFFSTSLNPKVLYDEKTGRCDGMRCRLLPDTFTVIKHSTRLNSAGLPR